MAEVRTDGSEPGAIDMFEAGTEVASALACRVCGALVAPGSEYRQAHWDWHEASNGV